MDETGVIIAIGLAVSVPGLLVFWLVAEFLADFHPQPRTNITRTTNTVNIHIHGDLIIQHGDGSQQRLPANQVQALLSAGGTVRIVDPARRTIEEYSRGQLVRRGELVDSSTSIVRGGR